MAAIFQSVRLYSEITDVINMNPRALGLRPCNIEVEQLQSRKLSILDPTIQGVTSLYEISFIGHDSIDTPWVRKPHASSDIFYVSLLSRYCKSQWARIQFWNSEYHRVEFKKIDDKVTRSLKQ